VPAFVPAIVHGHDWQAALAPAYLRYAWVPAAKSVLTIHNLAFQGNFPGAVFPELRLPMEANSIEGVEYYGGVSYLKGGLKYADAITTVSPTYAEEICSAGGGMGLDGLLRARHDVLHGIVNGVDTGVWNPAGDQNLVARYGAAKLKARAVNKRAVEERFGLDSEDGILFAVVSRLTWQKGMDLLGACIDGMVAEGMRLAVLGSGEAGLEAMFHAAAGRHRGRVGFQTAFDEPLSHLMQGGADAILVPSRFEPCGLTQFYGLRYGCVPVVARVGGLADTIIDANDAALSAGVATGLQFFPVDAPSLDRAIKRAGQLYRDTATWQTIQKRGMKSDVSWDKSAARYADLYKHLAGTG
jgi:starch synthase